MDRRLVGEGRGNVPGGKEIATMVGVLIMGFGVLVIFLVSYGIDKLIVPRTRMKTGR